MRAALPAHRLLLTLRGDWSNRPSRGTKDPLHSPLLGPLTVEANLLIDLATRIT